jgi:uncharacterized protein YcnI
LEEHALDRRFARRRAGKVLALASAIFLVAAAQASAHAVISPPTAEKGTLQVFTLSVPTEKENATTTKIELDVASGFAIDSFAPPPTGWKQSVQAKGSGEEAVVQKVTWTGGKTPTGQDSVFMFNASAPKSQDYNFRVIQTYSDGSVVDWSGPESSDTPAPVVKAVDSLEGGGSSSTLAVIAVIVAALALVLGIVALVGGRGGDRRPIA